MMKCIILDDEPMAQELLEEYVGKVPFLEQVGSFRSPMDALDRLQRGKPVDLLFLDINMPDLNGLELLRALPVRPHIILTTAYSAYAVQAFDLDVVDYLLKPIEFHRFLKAANKAYELFVRQAAESDPGHATAEVIYVKSGKDIIRLQLSEIEYIQGCGNYLSVRAGNRSVLILSTFKALQRQLPGRAFVRVHRSYIVALRHIETIGQNRVIVAGEEIPIGARFKHSFVQATQALQQTLR